MICKESMNGMKFKPHRFMFNNAKPTSLEGTTVSFTNAFGTAKSGFRNCRPRGKGWMVLLDGNQEYKMEFDQHDHMSNITYKGDIDDFEKDEWLSIKHDFPEKIDYAKVGTEQTPAGNEHDNLLQSWPSNPLTLKTYDYHIVTEKAPYTVRYTFNGADLQTTPARVVKWRITKIKIVRSFAVSYRTKNEYFFIKNRYLQKLKL